MFDIALAIAKLDGVYSMQPNSGLDLLRERNPELRFIFDELELLREDAEEAPTKEEVEEMRDRARDVERLIDKSADVVANCRDLLDIVRDMAAASGVVDLLTPISYKLDDLVNEIEEFQSA